MAKTLAEAGGAIFMGKNLRNPQMSDELLLENQIAKRKQEEEATQLGKLYVEAEQSKQDEINKKLEKLEMLPMGQKVILSAYPKNPYRKVVEGSIIVDYNGSFANPESGETEKMETGIGCAKVIEVGPECKYLIPGDDVYYETRTAYPVPFMNMGYIASYEASIICVLNEGLKERFKMN